MKEHLNELVDLAHEFEYSEMDAMIATQKLGIHSLKRLHREGSKRAHCVVSSVINYMIDNEMTPDIKQHIEDKYHQGEFKAHMEKYYDILCDFRKKVTDINAKITAEIGIPYEDGKKLFDDIYYRWEKYYRALQEFKLYSWNPAVIAAWNRYYHKKWKKEGY